MPFRSIQTRNALVVGVLMMVWAVVLWIAEEPTRPGGRRKASAVPAKNEARGGRPVYPYSVVPGGVYSGREAKEAGKKDPVVQKHYEQQGVNTNDLDAVKLKEERKGYVSYRVGDRVYWTKKKVPIKAGEVVVTDGTKKIRARCGNMISDMPKSPVLPVEPSDKEMNTPVEPAKPPETGMASLGGGVREEQGSDWWPLVASGAAQPGEGAAADGSAATSGSAGGTAGSLATLGRGSVGGVGAFGGTVATGAAVSGVTAERSKPSDSREAADGDGGTGKPDGSSVANRHVAVPENLVAADVGAARLGTGTTSLGRGSVGGAGALGSTAATVAAVQGVEGKRSTTASAATQAGGGKGQDQSLAGYIPVTEVGPIADRYPTRETAEGSKPSDGREAADADGRTDQPDESPVAKRRQVAMPENLVADSDPNRRIAEVPEPGTWVLVGGGIALIAALRRR